MKKYILLLLILLVAGNSFSARQIIDPDSDYSYRTRWNKGNANFTELYGQPSYGILQSDIDSWNGKQNRIAGTCSGGDSIQVINADGTVTCVSGGGGVSTWLGLSDTPEAYTADYYVKVNSSGTGLELVASGSGDVSGPATSIDNSFPRFDSTTGKIIQAGKTVEDDSGNVTINGDLTVTGQYLGQQSALGPQFTLLREDSDNGENYVGIGSQASNDNDLVFLYPSTDPTAGQVISWGVPSSVTFSDGVARDATIGTFVDQGSGGDTTYVEQATDPSAGDNPAGTWIFNTADGKGFFQSSTGLYEFAGTYTANPAPTYSLTLDFVDNLSGDTITVDGTTYSADTTITGLSDGAQTLTVAYGGTNDTVTWSGTDSGTVTGTDPNYSIDMNGANRSVTATFSVAGAGTVDCSGLGTWDFYYTVDHASGDNYACVGSSTEAGTFYGDMASSTDWNSTTGGTKSIVGSNADDYIEFPSHITGDEGYVKMTVYAPTDQTNRSSLFEYNIDTDNKISIGWRDGYGFRLMRTQDGTSIYASTSTSISVATNMVVEAKWSVSGDVMSIRVDGGAWVDTTGLTSLVGTEPTTQLLGEKYTGYQGQTMYIDDVYTSTSSSGGN